MIQVNHEETDAIKVTVRNELQPSTTMVDTTEEHPGRGRERRKERRKSNLLSHVGILSRPFEEPHHKEERNTSSLVLGNTWCTAEPY